MYLPLPRGHPFSPLSCSRLSPPLRALGRMAARTASSDARTATCQRPLRPDGEEHRIRGPCAARECAGRREPPDPIAVRPMPSRLRWPASTSPSPAHRDRSVPAGRYASSPTANASTGTSATTSAPSRTPSPSSRLPHVSAPMARTRAFAARLPASSSRSLDGVAVRTTPAPAAASPGEPHTLAGSCRVAANCPARDRSRLLNRCSPARGGP